MRILILQLKRIGDGILTAPALEMVRALWPEAVVEVVLHGPTAGLAPLLPGVDKLHCWREQGGNLGTLAAIGGGGWDLALDFTGTDRSFFLLGLSRARARFAWEKQSSARWIRRLATTHPVAASARDLSTVDYHLSMVREAARTLAGRELPPMPEPPHLLPPLLPPLAGELPDRYAVIHPGTARDEKYWAAESWLAVARHLDAAHGMPLVLTGSADARELAHLAPLRSAAHPAWIDLAGSLDLAGSAAVISRAALVLTVDSAAMHLAGQFGRPQVALFGPTNPFHWAPRHAKAITLADPGGRVEPGTLDTRKFEEGSMANITVDSVIQAVDSLL